MHILSYTRCKRQACSVQPLQTSVWPGPAFQLYFLQNSDLLVMLVQGAGAELRALAAFASRLPQRISPALVRELNQLQMSLP